MSGSLQAADTKSLTWRVDFLRLARSAPAMLVVVGGIALDDPSRHQQMMKRLLKCIEQLNKLTSKNDDTSWAMSQVAELLGEIYEALNRPGTIEAVAAMRVTKQAEHALREAAKAGATSLAIEWDSVDRSATVRISDGRPFRLQPKPAMLLDIIATPGDRLASDGLVGWHSYADVADLIEKRTGHGATVRNVSQTVHKLKVALRLAGQNWFLVQTDRRLSVRFALRGIRSGG